MRVKAIRIGVWSSAPCAPITSCRDSQSDLILIIHLQQPDRGAAHGSDSDDSSILRPEMFGPCILPWMKQLENFAAVRVNARQVRALVQIAVGTGKSQILSHSQTAMLPWDDVLDMK